MAAKNLICLVVERLHAGMVGAYGNSWIRTAAIDGLACESFLFDQAFLESPLIDRTYRAYWQGIHGGEQRAVSERAKSLPAALASAGWNTTLVTDSAEVAGLLPSSEFTDRVLVDIADQPQTAKDLSDTGLARLFGAATETMGKMQEPFCLWVHSRGLAGPWDAPLEMRNRFADEDDPEPPTLVEVPNYWLPDNFDPDEPLGIKHAYAGQIALLDLCLGAFLDEFAASPLANNTLLSFLSTSGFPLGEHLRIGACDDALYNENAQLVWLMRFPDGLGKLSRTQALVQPSDLPAALLDWAELTGVTTVDSTASGNLLPIVHGEIDSIRDRALLVGPHDHALRTAAWHLRQPSTGAAELYAKPSDRWEVNEVANLLPDIELGMKTALLEMEQRGPDQPLSSLDESLLRELD